MNIAARLLSTDVATDGSKPMPDTNATGVKSNCNDRKTNSIEVAAQVSL
jgi:hypothetical protein